MLAERKPGYYESHEPVGEPRKVIRRKKKTRVLLNTQLRSRCRALFVLLAALALAVTAHSGLNASRGYALVSTQQQTQQLEQENERLKIEIAQLKSPQRIKNIATKDLGMTVPEKVYYSHDN